MRALLSADTSCRVIKGIAKEFVKNKITFHDFFHNGDHYMKALDRRYIIPSADREEVYICLLAFMKYFTS